ncbi:hypothetical protein [Chitinimonas taiwanensis]|uniref:hypothetical protein n=1 Tax=Chitinimonas taiwanensis TaxID=240412 RepID=UPI0035B0672D
MFDFKGLIDALLRRARAEEDSGPSLTRLMVDLPRDESLRALTEIVKAVAALNRNPKVGLKERHRAVQGFDDKARPLMHTLVAVYRGEIEIEGIAARQVLPSLMACWQELASAYKLCLKQHAQQPAARFAGEAELITLRALAYYTEQARWTYLRNFEPEARIWRNLNRLYLIADSAGFAHKPLQRYPHEMPSQISSYYLHIVLLKLAEPERRNPEALHYLDSMLPEWLKLLRLEKVIRVREQSFAINLDDTKPPMKLRRNMVGERYRYLDTEPLATHLREMSPHPLDGPALEPLALSLRQQLLNDLAIVYSRAGQSRARRNERRAKDSPVPIALGLAQIARALQRNASAAEWESWSLCDESHCGIGAHYRARYDDRLAVGELLVMRHEQQVGLYVVRRLHKQRDGQVRVGAERICPQVQLVRLQHGDDKALALFCADSQFGGRILLLDHGLYHEGDEALLQAGPQQFRIQYGPALERLPAQLLCPFKVLEKRSLGAASATAPAHK